MGRPGRAIACGIGVQAMSDNFRSNQYRARFEHHLSGPPHRAGRVGGALSGLRQLHPESDGGVCPITRCCQELLNGPCGGSQRGKCEVNAETHCAWQLIYDRLNSAGLRALMEIQPPKDWSTSRDGGPRKIVREDLKLTRPE